MEDDRLSVWVTIAFFVGVAIPYSIGGGIQNYSLLMVGNCCANENSSYSK